MSVLMWEVRGDADGLIAWLREDVLPALPDSVSAELFRSADRVVALVRPVDAGFRLPDPPAALVARPPHAWTFDAVPINTVPIDTVDTGVRDPG